MKKRVFVSPVLILVLMLGRLFEARPGCFRQE